jgi:hypothetical protein
VEFLIKLSGAYGARLLFLFLQKQIKGIIIIKFSPPSPSEDCVVRRRWTVNTSISILLRVPDKCGPPRAITGYSEGGKSFKLRHSIIDSLGLVFIADIIAFTIVTTILVIPDIIDICSRFIDDKSIHRLHQKAKNAKNAPTKCNEYTRFFFIINHTKQMQRERGGRVLFIGSRFSNLYSAVDTPAAVA